MAITVSPGSCDGCERHCGCSDVVEAGGGFVYGVEDVGYRLILVVV